MTFAIFHDFPGLENGLPKFHDQGAPCSTEHIISCDNDSVPEALTARMHCTYPEKKLNKHEVAEGSSNVKSSTSVCFAVRSVDVVMFAVCQHKDRIADILPSDCIHQLLHTQEQNAISK